MVGKWWVVVPADGSACKGAPGSIKRTEGWLVHPAIDLEKIKWT
jgi:hypothetical protein